MSLTQVAPGMMTSTAQYVGFKNRIINGAMVIDQRNNGSSFLANTNGAYTVDRWAIGTNPVGRITVGRNLNSLSSLPAGFTNYLGAQVTTPTTFISTYYFGFDQPVEGFNFYDLGWGTANAKPATLSFWVQSSLTGTFGGSLQGYTAGALYYPFSYTITSANTWQYITVSIPGPTTGTFTGASNTGIFSLNFSMGTGSTYQNTAGVWTSSNSLSCTGEVQLAATSGATFYITGVQLEAGTQATTFDYRDYGRELHMCWRYFQTYSFVANAALAIGQANTVSSANAPFFFTQPFRATPGTITIPAVGGTTGLITFTTPAGGYPSTYGTIVVQQASPTSFMFYASGFTSQWAVGNALYLYNTGGVSISASAEL
jgi:hypothetical protein